jgi:hypothetical protein
MAKRRRDNIKKRGQSIEEPFVAHRRSLMESPAWRALNIAERRLLDRLELEILSNGGNRANGSLEVSYEQFHASRVRRDSIRSALDVTIALGLVVITEQGHGGRSSRRGSKYKLTYLSAPVQGGLDLYAPTDEWRSITAADAKRILAQVKPPKRDATRTRNATETRFFPAPQNGGSSPLKTGVENGTFHPSKRGSKRHFPPLKTGVSSISCYEGHTSDAADTKANGHDSHPTTDAERMALKEAWPGVTPIEVMLPSGPATLWLPDYIQFEGTIMMPVETPDGVVHVPVSRSRH